MEDREGWNLDNVQESSTRIGCRTMNRVVLSLQGCHAATIRCLKNPNDAAFLVFGASHVLRDPWTKQSVVRYTSHEIFENGRVESALAMCRNGSANDGEQILGIVRFSGTTPSCSSDSGCIEQEHHEVSISGSGPNLTLISISIVPDGRLNPRVSVRGSAWKPVDLTIEIGDRFNLHYSERDDLHSPRYLHRQALALGDVFNRDIASLRYAIVGCGATGSATAHLLKLNGAEKIALFDTDLPDETSVNRMHLLRRDDLLTDRTKAQILSESLNAIGVGDSVMAYNNWINDPVCRDALKSCDLIFGCTDDHAGRLLLNRYAYFYNTPLIDMGLSIEVGDGSPPKIQAFDGRVSVVQPGAPCLLCSEVVNPIVARDQALKMLEPEEYERRKEEAYIIGEGNPSPAVSTFTSSVATMALEELTHRLQGFRGTGGSINNRLRKFARVMDRRLGHQPKAECPICGCSDYWGVGDVDPFLDQAN